ncbi:hypothetical protein FGLOB1_12915 [Fusarium globosum]|uniref:Uncharacterized protein n=1 Tax=Fusarium globosum TaxID=78864 RepID=A0A8H5XP71_9HYPO|nr:hypothetical protein FGLOB1_12915 [Fusarium globosum]
MRPLPQPPWMRNYRRKVPSIIASIRNLPEGVTPTLESIPQIDESLKATEPFSPFSSLIRDMQETEFERWGTRWESYIEFFKATVEDTLNHLELGHSSSRTLNGLSRKIAKLSVMRRRSRVVVCVVLDGKCEPGGRGRNGYLSIERYTKEHTGWIYTGVEGIPELYNRLFYEELEAQDFPKTAWGNAQQRLYVHRSEVTEFIGVIAKDTIYKQISPNWYEQYRFLMFAPIPLMELRPKSQAACNTDIDAVAFLYKDKIFPQ